MSFFQKLLTGTRPNSPALDGLHCDHASLSPMWESVTDMGESDKVSRYRCLGCGVFLDATTAPRDADRGQATAAAPTQQRRVAA